MPKIVSPLLILQNFMGNADFLQIFFSKLETKSSLIYLLHAFSFDLNPIAPLLGLRNHPSKYPFQITKPSSKTKSK